MRSLHGQLSDLRDLDNPSPRDVYVAFSNRCRTADGGYATAAVTIMIEEAGHTTAEVLFKTRGATRVFYI